MQCNVFYYGLMMHALEDSKKEKKSTSFRSSHSHMFFKIGVLENSAIFTGNTCVVGISSCNFSKKRLHYKCFPKMLNKKGSQVRKLIIKFGKVSFCYTCNIKAAPLPLLTSY